MTQLAAYVESVAGDNEQLILSAGMDMRGTAGRGHCDARSAASFDADRRRSRRRNRLELGQRHGRQELRHPTESRSSHADHLGACGSFDEINIHCCGAEQRHALLVSGCRGEQFRSKRLERFGYENRAVTWERGHPVRSSCCGVSSDMRSATSCPHRLEPGHRPTSFGAHPSVDAVHRHPCRSFV